MGVTPNSEQTTAKLHDEQQTTPGLPPVALNVTGNPRELAASIQSLVRNEIIAQTILALCPNPTSNISVKLSKVKEVAFTCSRGDFSIELPSETRIPRAQDMVARGLVRETVFSSLAHFARTGSESPHSRERLLNLAQLTSKKNISDENLFKYSLV